MNENEKEFLMFYMDQTWQEMRHLENLRERMTILVVTISSAIVGFIIQQKYVPETKPFVFFVIGLGVFGCLASQKLFQIHQLAQGRLNRWYEYLLQYCGPEPKIIILRDEADKEMRDKFPYTSTVKHNYFWALIHIFIVIVGIILLRGYSS